MSKAALKRKQHKGRRKVGSKKRRNRRRVRLGLKVRRKRQKDERTPSEKLQDEIEPIPCPMHEDYDE